MRPVIDLFAGPGGWEVGGAALGLEPLGVEWDSAACATRAAAGLRTLQGDVGGLDPRRVLSDEFGHVGLWGLIASPPCQAFSMAGSGAGRAAMEVYREAIERTAYEAKPPSREELDEACGDPRAHLVLEPLRWALELGPRWIALEQVEPVLPLWECMARAFKRYGYWTWTGVLSAERYGVPQTRRRAILLASLDGPVGEPPASHRRYIAPRRRDEATLGLFDAPEPERIVAPEDEHLLPWVSMADALGWVMPQRPYLAVACSRSTGGPDKEKVGGSAARATIYDEQAAGRWRFRATNDRPNACEREAGEPAPSLAFGHNPPRWIVDTGNTRGGGAVSPSSDRIREVDLPAPPLTTRADQMEWREDAVPVAYDSRGQRDGRTRELNRQRSVDEPAPTIAGESRNDSWVHERPATTVAGDPRVHPPGHKENALDEPGRFEQRRGENAVRVTLQEALVLQSFPASYPVQGTKTKQFEQVGNAVPPLLAAAVLRLVAA